MDSWRIFSQIFFCNCTLYAFIQIGIGIGFKIILNGESELENAQKFSYFSVICKNKILNLISKDIIIITYS